MELDNSFKHLYQGVSVLPWAYPYTDIHEILLPEPYGDSDDATRRVAEMLKLLSSKGLTVPRFTVETRFEILNGKPCIWITDVRGRGGEVSGYQLSFRIVERGNERIVRLHNLRTPTFQALLGADGLWTVTPKREVTKRFFATDPVERGISKMGSLLDARASDQPVKGWKETISWNQNTDRDDKYGYKLFEVVGAKEAPYEPVVHVETTPVLYSTCGTTQDWRWKHEVFWQRDCTNTRFFKSVAQPGSEAHAFFRERAEWVLPGWQKLYFYPLAMPAYLGIHAYWRDPEMKHRMEENRSPGNLLVLLVPYPAPQERRLCLLRNGDWFDPGR